MISHAARNSFRGVRAGHRHALQELSRRAQLKRIQYVIRSSLVDPASSHMLVSKIKPCMSQYMPY